MIVLYIEPMEFYNEDTNEFESYDDLTVKFEYSLASVAEWEAKWAIPYLNTELAITDPKFIDFCLCMALDKTLTLVTFNSVAASLLNTFAVSSAIFFAIYGSPYLTVSMITCEFVWFDAETCFWKAY